LESHWIPRSTLGHQDGGALWMKTHGHLRDEPRKFSLPFPPFSQVSEEMLREITLLAPEDAALFRQLKCPACRCSKLDFNANCDHNPKSPGLLRKIRMFRINPALARTSPSLAGRSCCFALIQGGAAAPPHQSGCGDLRQRYEIHGLEALP
jgi:hypothetical protein